MAPWQSINGRYSADPRHGLCRLVAKLSGGLTSATIVSGPTEGILIDALYLKAD